MNEQTKNNFAAHLNLDQKKIHVIHGIYAGDPARRIGEVDEFYEKRKEAQLEEAKELALAYYARYQTRPPETVFHEYFMLFEDSNSAQKKDWCSEKMRQGGNFDESLEYLRVCRPQFNSYDDFMAFCFGKKDTVEQKN